MMSEKSRRVTSNILQEADSYLLTESGVSMGKYNSDILQYWKAIARSIWHSRGLRFSHKDWMSKVNDLFIIW